MSIFKTTFDTFLGKRLIVTQLREALQELQVRDSTLSMNRNAYLHLSFKVGDAEGGYLPSIIAPGSTAQEALPIFYHPIPVEMPTGKGMAGGNYLVGDARSFMRAGRDGVPYIANVMEFEFLQARIGLGSIWLTQGPVALRNISPIAQSIYASWISQTVSQRLGLDLGDMMRLRILAAFFYHCLFIDKSEFRDDEINRLAVIIAKAAKAPADETASLMERVGYIEDVTDFVNKIVTVMENPRFENFNVGLLNTVISGTWFGLGGKEVACVALEHPPTFLAMIYASFGQRGYKMAAFTRVTEIYKGPKGEQDFIRTIHRTLYGS